MRQTGIVGFPMLWVGAMGFPLSIKQTCLVFEVYQMNCVPMPCVWTLEKVVKVVLKHCTKGGWGGGVEGEEENGEKLKTFQSIFADDWRISADPCPSSVSEKPLRIPLGRTPPHVPHSILDFLSRCGRAISHFIDAANQSMKDVHRIMAGECFGVNVFAASHLIGWLQLL